MVIYFPLLIALIGAVCYVICAHANPTNTTGAELGRLAWFAGLLAFLLKFAPDYLVTK